MSKYNQPLRFHINTAVTTSKAITAIAGISITTVGVCTSFVSENEKKMMKFEKLLGFYVKNVTFDEVEWSQIYGNISYL